MNTVIKKLVTSFLLFGLHASAQTVTGLYKIDDLLLRIKHPDTTYVVNFWATWCKPCIQELPAFDSLDVLSKGSATKIILVSLDFKEDAKKTSDFLTRRSINAECVLLDEVNGNDFINKIDPKWSGAIPATLLKKSSTQIFLEKKLNLAELKKSIKEIGP